MAGPVHEIRLQPFKVVLFIFVILLFVSLSFLAGYKAGSSGKKEEKLKPVSWEEAYSLQPAGEQASLTSEGPEQQSAEQLPAAAESAEKTEAEKAVRSKSSGIEEASTPPSGGGYAVQVAAFRAKEGALRVAEKYRKQGYSAFVKQETVRGRRLYKVYIGPFPTKQRAVKVKSQLEKKERKKFLLRRLD